MRLLDQILVIDVEATCWDGPTPEGQESEIIEIGLCLLDVATRERHGKRRILVRPERSTVSPFCSRLTGLTQKLVDTGISFEEACSLLRDEYASSQRVWASYGDADRLRFERQCQQRQIAYPFSPKHINAKILFAVQHGLKKEVGMARALQILEVPLEGTHHSGADDAWNIALILASILQGSSLK
ncbi:inhibitor of KinA sporulation pathway (predicted exonuclease) [Thermosporothrix hazakensis]|jgi:inhibitor of KinA sporulation pathway (predicted exonuclease)|uniref:Inhibitor of KinA sporulation pathway (Predicted exonuclease) n=2 Tax=Thermosporothrix TaxID=768650 RepID=A0A326U9R7_THEHA|nr:3'-5' exonuclease [Thermosporothrix hazakensis]PZW31153.1 inhibitor of KinA sporulation pathway (predicted exonuclease) [Thermosporothrix hazakensis]BBH86626.1 exonuclease [Thermosporothrix sp. COM3]GCE50935.1 exonuclease [Thermosporothrix hazakensis]